MCLKRHKLRFKTLFILSGTWSRLMVRSAEIRNPVRFYRLLLHQEVIIVSIFRFFVRFWLT